MLGRPSRRPRDLKNIKVFIDKKKDFFRSANFRFSRSSTLDPDSELDPDPNLPKMQDSDHPLHSRYTAFPASTSTEFSRSEQKSVRHGTLVLLTSI